MTDTDKVDWEAAYNATDMALGRIEGLAVALKDIVEDHFSSSEKPCRALTALVDAINEKVDAVFDLRSAEYAAGRKSAKVAA